MEHYLPSKPGNVHWGLWDGTLKPVLTIRSGERLKATIRVNYAVGCVIRLRR